LHHAFELSWGPGQRAFTIGHGQPARRRTIAARDLAAWLREIAKAKRRFGLADDAAVVSCYQAGRDGFWLHRWLPHQGIANVLVDAASLEVNRRKRRAKSDHRDAAQLVSRRVRYHAGETKVGSVVRGPEAADEDRRHRHRALIAVQDERTEHVHRSQGLLAGQGIALPSGTAEFPEEGKRLRCGEGAERGADLRQRLRREFARWQLADQHVKELEHERKQRLRRADTPQVERGRGRLELAGIGRSGSWLLVDELFGWRQFTNRRQVGAIGGLPPTPYQSGDDSREQGISKAGSKVRRRMMVELAGGWLRWQPDSERTRWYARRFADHGKRARKGGVVALARKLLIALWRFVEQGEVPAGARLTSWRAKVNAKATGAGKRCVA
jgi:transposase